MHEIVSSAEGRRNERACWSFAHKDKQNEVSRRRLRSFRPNWLQEEGSIYLSTLSQRYEELQVQLMEMMNGNTRLAEENS